MSENKEVPSQEPVNKDVPKDEFVAKKAFEEVTKDMHKFKSKARDAEARAAEFEARLKAMQEEDMLKNEQYKDLAEKYKGEAEQERQQRLRDRELYLETTKRAALKQELGGSVKDEYLVHADIGAIEVDENGNIVRDSLQSVANAFRQEHGLLLGNPKGSNPTSIGSNVNATAGAVTKSIDDMSTEELAEQLRQLKENRS